MLRILGLSVLALLFGPSLSVAFCFEEAGKAYDVNPKLLKTIAMTESNLRPDAVNKNRNGTLDIGLMQINSSWIEILGLNAGHLIQDPCYNTLIGAKILRQCIDRRGYTWEAVGCYNASSRAKQVKYSWRILNQMKRADNTLYSGHRGRYAQKAEGREAGNKEHGNSVSEFYFNVREK